MKVPQNTRRINSVLQGNNDNLLLQTTSSIPRRLPSLPRFLLSTFLLLFLLLSPTSAQAQADDTPTPVYRAQSTSIDDNVLYIRGGFSEGNAVSQFYSLDLSPFLSASVTTTKLNWKKLNATGPIEEFGVELPLAVHYGTRDVTFFGSSRTQSRFNTTKSTWGTANLTCPFDNEYVYVNIPSSRGGRVAVTDPNNNLVYLPHASEDGANMILMFLELGNCYFMPMPTGSVGNNFVWSQFKGTIYMLGNQTIATATNPTGKDPMLWELSQDNNIWQHLPNPNTPPLFKGSCAVSALGGRKLLFFGGTSGSGQANGNMYIFDTLASTWTVGATSVKPRSNMVCASAGDYFLVWGGHENETSTTASSEMLLYNFKTDIWTNQTKKLIPPPLGASNTDTPSKTNTAAIGGGAAAAFVLVVAIVGLVVLRRHRRQQAAAKRHPQDSKLDPTPPSHPPNMSASYAALIAKIQLDSVLPNTPHAPPPKLPTPTHCPRGTTSRQNTAQGQTDITDTENQPGLEFFSMYANQDPQELLASSTIYTTSLSSRTLVSHPLPPKWNSQSNTQTQQTHLYSSPQIYSQELEQLPWEQPISNPQYIEPLSPSPPPPVIRSHRSPDYARIQLEFPSPPAVAQNPQKLAKDSSSPINPLERMVLAQEHYEQDVDRLRKEEQVELERTRKRWEEQMSGRP
ncbi:MAG: hypothetical protein J3R72DRAFT_470505 [Linnemannia gamsii]|nr:MAG: hypothetical protein J3R72DRAFT_470505 [Linnemannia gamsii]